VERYDWAQSRLDTIMKGQAYTYLIGRDYTSAADYSAQSDDFIWEVAATYPPFRAIYTFELEPNAPCVAVEVRKFNAWHPWRLDPINHPYQLQCRMCEGWFSVE